MKNPLNNSGKIFRWYIWVPYSAAFVCTNTEQQYHQCETNTIDTWTQIQSISRYNDHGVRGTIGVSIFLGDQEPQPPVKSGHSSICPHQLKKKTHKNVVKVGPPLTKLSGSAHAYDVQCSSF